MLLSVVLSAAAEEDCADSVVFAVVVDAVVVVGLGFSGGKIDSYLLVCLISVTVIILRVPYNKR